MYKTGFGTNRFPVQYNGVNGGTAEDCRQQHRQRAVINLKPEASSYIFPRQQNYGARNNQQQQTIGNYSNQLRQRYVF